MGIRCYSAKKDVAAKYEQFGITEKNAYLFIGREVGGVPVGLLVYAGGVQDGLWADVKPDNELASRVFALAALILTTRYQ